MGGGSVVALKCWKSVRTRMRDMPNNNKNPSTSDTHMPAAEISNNHASCFFYFFTVWGVGGAAIRTKEIFKFLGLQILYFPILRASPGRQTPQDGLPGRKASTTRCWGLARPRPAQAPCSYSSASWKLYLWTESLVQLGFSKPPSFLVKDYGLHLDVCKVRQISQNEEL